MLSTINLYQRHIFRISISRNVNKLIDLLYLKNADVTHCNAMHESMQRDRICKYCKRTGLGTCIDRKMLTFSCRAMTLLLLLGYCYRKNKTNILAHSLDIY